MPTFVKYRGAAKVPATRVATVKRNGKTMVKLKPRADWHNPGEGKFVFRSPDKVYSQSAPIPRRKKK